MKKEFSKSEARDKIEKFFERENWKPEEMKKIKRLAMKYRISLRENKKNFCKKCYSKLHGKTRVNKLFRNVECEKCRFLNRTRFSSKSPRRN